VQLGRTLNDRSAIETTKVQMQVEARLSRLGDRSPGLSFSHMWKTETGQSGDAICSAPPVRGLGRVRSPRCSSSPRC